MSVEFQQLKPRAAPFLLPLPAGIGEGAAAASARLEPAYQAAAAEVGKLDMPSQGAVDWKLVHELCEGLLRTRTTDLLLGAWLAHALQRLRGFDGLATGATLLAELIDQRWESLQPELKRMRARVNALQWFLEKTLLCLPDAEQESKELPALEALHAALGQLAQVVRVRFAASAPALSPLLSRVEKLRASAAEALAREQPASPPEPAQPGPGASASGANAAANQGLAPAAALGPLPAQSLSAAADATDFLRGVGGSLLAAAATLRRTDATDPVSYRVLRTGLWLHIAAPPPASGGRTQVPPPPEALRAQLATLARNQKWAALLEEAESAAPLHRFALDLHRLSWEALAGLGPALDAARRSIVTELRALLSRLPQLPVLLFADGSPFVDAQTSAWIGAHVEAPAAGGEPAGGVAAGADAQGAARLSEARKLLGQSQIAQGLSLLQDAVSAAQSGRARFVARLELARAASTAGLGALAKATYDDLARDSAARDLDGWEPALVASCLRGLITTSRALDGDPRGKGVDLPGAWARLCRVDPACAHEVWP